MIQMSFVVTRCKNYREKTYKLIFLFCVSRTNFLANRRVAV